MANTIAIIMAASVTSPTNCHVVAAQHEQYNKKSLSSNEKYWRIVLREREKKKVSGERAISRESTRQKEQQG